ncbi:hypothetical protein [Streptomyces sp. Je 1-332]|uniref:hypothetical protein n=1 Tax=Streptomyces sp. Je 1-332 TaxID=3231270 RepID=UPI00345B265E
MSAEMVAALGALAVAAVGAVTGIYSTRVTLREQNRLSASEATLQRELQMAHHAADLEREWSQATADALVASHVYMGSCWELAQELGSSGRTPSKCEERYVDFSLRWEETKRAFVAVGLKAPTSDVREKTDQLNSALITLGDLMATWFHELKEQDWQRVRTKWSRFEGLKNAAHQATSDFDRALRGLRAGA